MPDRKEKAKEDAPNYRRSEIEDQSEQEKSLELEKPHGFLMWKGKQVALANDQPLPVGETLLIISDGEAYGKVVLSPPSQMTVKEFERKELAVQHCVYPRERRQWWPEQESLFVHQFEKWEPFAKSRLVKMEDGKAVYEEAEMLTPNEKGLIELSQSLPKVIPLLKDAVSLCIQDPRLIAVDKALNTKLRGNLGDVLKASFQNEVQYISGKAAFDRLPLYSLALVRSPRLTIKRGDTDAPSPDIEKQEDDMPWKIQERGEQQCVIKVDDDSVVQCYTGPEAEARARALLAALNINVDKETHNDGDEDDDEDRHKDEYDEAELAIDEKARWTRKFINDLPDSHFLYIETGGKLDDEGKTKPRIMRHFPYKNSAGDIDLPHLRNAIARIPLAKDRERDPLSDSLKDRLQREAREILDKENERLGLKEITKVDVAELDHWPDLSEKVETKAGRRLRKSWIDRIKDFRELLKDFLGWAEYQDIEMDKAFDPDYSFAIKEVDGELRYVQIPLVKVKTPFSESLLTWLKNETRKIKDQDTGFALKEVDGEVWYFTWSTNAFKDRQGEIFSTQSLEQYVEEAKEREEKGFFNFWHIDGTDFARKVWQAVVGRFLVEAGPFLKNEAGQRALKFFTEFASGHSEFAPEGWGCSPEYRYLPEEREKSIYNWIWITRTSTLPRAAAANIWTGPNQEVKIMSLEGQQKEAAIALFGKEFVDNLITQGEKRTQKLEEAGVDHKGISAGTKQVEKFVEKLQKLAEVTSETLKEQLVSMAESLTEENLAEQGQALQELSEDVEDMEIKDKLVEVAAEMVEQAGEEEESGLESAVDAESASPPSFTINQIVEALSQKVARDFEPFAEALATLALGQQETTDRLNRLETQKALKEEVELPRFVMSVQRAANAKNTIVAEDDPLKKQKPAETTPGKKSGTYASSYFG